MGALRAISTSRTARRLKKLASGSEDEGAKDEEKNDSGNGD
jgi:hypothetical protein